MLNKEYVSGEELKYQLASDGIGVDKQIVRDCALMCFMISLVVAVMTAEI